MKSGSRPLDKMIASSDKINKINLEIDRLFKNRVNKDFFTTEEIKKIDYLVLDFLELCVKELSKIKDVEVRDQIYDELYFKRYNFSINGTDTELSDDVSELFDLTWQGKDANKILREIKRVRQELSKIYI